VRSSTYIFVYVFVPVTDCSCVRIGCAPQLRCRSLLRRRRPADLVFRPCWPAFTCLLPYDEKSRDRRCVQTWGAISRHFSSQTLLNKDRQCCESWARSSCTVCCGWYDWWRPLSRSAVLFATLWHCRELSDERYAHHIQFEFWVLQQLTPVVTDRPKTVLRRQQSVPLVSTTQLPRRVCCSALATCG